MNKTASDIMGQIPSQSKTSPAEYAMSSLAARRELIGYHTALLNNAAHALSTANRDDLEAMCKAESVLQDAAIAFAELVRR